MARSRRPQHPPSAECPQSDAPQPNQQSNRKSRNKERKPFSSYLPSIFSFKVSTHALNKLVCLCAGRNAKYMLDRKYTLRRFQSIPDPGANLCDKCKDTRIWANMVGGEGSEREGITSNVYPWLKPNFGITFRYRVDSSSSPSSYSSPETIFYCEHRKSPDQSDSGVTSSLELLRTVAKGKNLVLLTPPPPKPRWSPTPPPAPPKRLPATPYTRASDYERSTGAGIFGPRRLNPSTVVPYTANGRPVICHDHLIPEEPPQPFFPPRHIRVRFDPRTSVPLTECPDFDEQPSARVPPFETIPIEGVLPYKLVPQFCQDWDPPAFIITSMDDFDPGLVWLRRNGLSREASLRPRLMSLNKTYNDGKTNMDAFVAARGNLKLTCGPEELATKGYLLPEPPVKSRRAKPNEVPKRTAQSSNTKKRSSGKAGTNGSRSTTHAPHDLFPITEVPNQETIPCDATVATQAQSMRQATKDAAAKKQANGTRRVKSEGKIPRVAVPDIEKYKGKRRSVSGPSTKISKEEASRQAAGAKSVGRKKPDFVIGGTSYTLKEETEPKMCTSALAAGFLSESLKARISQEGKPNSIPFSQEPTLRTTILKRPLYTFVPKDAITTPLPASGQEIAHDLEVKGTEDDPFTDKAAITTPLPMSSKEIAQELELDEAGIGGEDTFVDRTAITTPLPESSKEIAQDLGSEHGWEDCTGNNSPAEEEFDPKWFLEQPPSSPFPAAIPAAIKA